MRFDPSRADLQSWFRTIAHRRAIDRLRSLEASRASDLRVGTREFTETDHSTDPWDSFERRRHLRDALDQLSERQRTAVTVRYLGERKTVELARILGVSVGTANTRVRDGLLELRQHLQSTT